MGLFDDLLGTSSKVQETTIPQPSMSTPNIDPMAVMNEQTTSTPPEVDAFLNMSAGTVTADMPSYTDRKANGEVVSTTTLTTENVISDQPIIEPAIVETPVLDLFGSSSEVVTPVVEAAVATSEVTSAQSPIIEDNTTVVEAPVLDFGNIVSEENIYNSTDSNEVSLPIVESSEVEAVSENSIFGFDSTEAVVAEAEAEVSKTPVVDAISTENAQSPENIFGFDSSENTSAIEEKNTESVIEENPNISSTSDFIAASLLQLDKMEKTLADRKAKFLSEAESYRLEKEKFAQLEAEAIANSSSMDDEQAKINTMRNYFQKQQKQESEITDSVNTALAGIATQKAVGNAMKKSRTTSKKVELV